VAESLKAGEMPAVVVDPVTRSVEMRTSKGICREAAGKWAARRLPGVAEPAATAPAASAPAAPAPAAPAAKGHTSVSVPIPDAPARPAPPPAPRCDRLVDGLWRSTWVRLGGELFWLERAYTIDFDNDGRTDNVGFRLRSASQGREVGLHYLPREGEVGGNSLPELQIDDDRNVPRICFGVVDLNQPPPDPQGMAAATRIVPDLSAEVRGRVSGEGQPQPAANSGGGAPDWLWGAVAGGLGVLIGIAGVAWGILRGRRGKPVEEAADEEEEGEEERERPSHHGKAAPHKPAQPERHGHPAEEDEEVESPARKSGGGLFGFMAGLFGSGRKRKKPAKHPPEDHEGHPHAKAAGHHPPAKPGATPQRGAASPRKVKPSN
jgi:hypothetical protein